MRIATCNIKGSLAPNLLSSLMIFEKPQLCGKPQWSLSSANLPIITCATDGQNGGMGEEGAGLKGGEYHLRWDVDSEVSSLACYVVGGWGRREGGAVLETTRASESHQGLSAGREQAQS